jgi:acyl carrier protein
MRQDEIYTALGEIFADLFERDDIVVTPELCARHVKGWDSFRQIEIILAVQRRFRIKLTAREQDSLLRVADLAALIDRKLP